MWPFVIIEWKKVHREMWQPPFWFPKMIYILDHMFRYVLLLPSPLYHIKCSVNALRDKWRQINQPFCIWYDAISVNHSILWMMQYPITTRYSEMMQYPITARYSEMMQYPIATWYSELMQYSIATRYSEMMQYPITTQVLRLPGTYPRSLFHRSVQYA